jgi:glycosyltransferase involved in cell wall biosynthesis
MKIVMTTDTFWPRVNGVTVAIDTFRRELRRLGHTVYIFAPRYPAEWSGFAVPDDDQVFRFPSFSFPLSPEDRLGYPTVRLRIRRLLEELQPDVVHSHSEFTIGFGGKSYCVRNSVPHVMTCHTYWENYITTYVPIIPAFVARAVASTWSRSDYRLVDYLTVPSQWLSELIASYDIQPPIAVIPNGINPEEFHMEPAEREAAAARFAAKVPGLDGKRVLLYAGRLAKEKNIDFLLEVMLRVRESCPETVLVIAGRGPHDASLRETVAEKGLSNNVRFAGYLDRKELSYAHSISEAFVFASKTETQGLVLIEAMMCRSPVVTVTSPGTSEVMAEQKGGYLVDEDVTEFTDKVLLLLNDRELHERKREEAWETAQTWTAAKMTEKLVEVYEKAIQNRKFQDPAQSA